MSFDFERLFKLTMDSLTTGGFRLPRQTSDAAMLFLATARDVVPSLAHTKPSQIAEHLRQETHVRLGNRRPSRRVANGYALAERTLSYHHRAMTNDKSVERTNARTAARVRNLVKDKAAADELYAAIGVRYLEVYVEMTALQLFLPDGRPVGRAQMAKFRVLEQLPRSLPRSKRQEMEDILDELVRVTKSLGKGAASQE